jgi:hypothetical protein
MEHEGVSWPGRASTGVEPVLILTEYEKLVIDDDLLAAASLFQATITFL